jgi:hypothetical protein
LRQEKIVAVVDFIAKRGTRGVAGQHDIVVAIGDHIGSQEFVVVAHAFHHSGLVQKVGIVFGKIRRIVVLLKELRGCMHRQRNIQLGLCIQSFLFHIPYFHFECRIMVREICSVCRLHYLLAVKIKEHWLP